MEKWQEQLDARIKTFAECTKMAPEVVAAKLVALVGEPGESTIALLGSEEALPFGDLRKEFCEVEPKMPIAVLRNCQGILRGNNALISTDGTAVATVGGGTPMLPALPEGETAILEAFKSGGKLKTEPANILAVIRAGLAGTTGLFEAPGRLLDLIESYAENRTHESVPEAWFNLNRYVKSQKYAEVFEAMGVEGGGAIITSARKKALLVKIDQYLWPALQKFFAALIKWDGMLVGDSGDALGVMAKLAVAQQSGIPRDSIIQMPDGQFVRDAAEVVNDAVNMLFGGLGLFVARGMAFEATKIRDLLSVEGLPAMIGAADRDDMMVNKLKLAVNASDITFEKNLAKFAWGVLKIGSIPTGNTSKEAQDAETGYMYEMIRTGKLIDFNVLVGGSSSRIESDFDPDTDTPPAKGRKTVIIGRG
jgi:hypothetical protein